MVFEVNIIQGQHHSNFALIHFYAQIIIILHITFSPRGKHDISNCIGFYTYYSIPNKSSYMSLNLIHSNNDEH